MRLLISLCVSALPCGAETLSAPRLAFPVACDPDKNCYIQNYFDHDPSSGITDSACSALTYDGHSGTDIALPFREDISDNIAIRPALSGTVRAVRDGEADGAMLSGQSVAGKDCGNGVVIDHAGGWQTQYCHLKQGSVAIDAGDHVNEDTLLGFVGQSGRAEFPHLHFELRHNGISVDPFTNTTEDCRTKVSDTQLWDPPVSYQPSGILATGMTDSLPNYEDIKQGHLPPPPDQASHQLIVWVYGYGAAPQRPMDLSISGPGIALTQQISFKKTQALYLRYIGKRMPDGLTAGSYSYRLARGTQTIASGAVTLP